MKISLISGSPKIKNSCSQYLLEEIKKLITGDNDFEEFITCATPLPRKSLESIYNSNIIVFSFPLYVDSIPSHFLNFLQTLEKLINEKGTPNIFVYAIANCGFYEGEQNKIAIEILENWCLRCNLSFNGALGIGGGPSLPSLTSVPFGHGPKKDLGQCLTSFAENISNCKKDPNVYVHLNFPKNLYIISGNHMWNTLGKQNGLSKKDITIAK